MKIDTLKRRLAAILALAKSSTNEHERQTARATLDGLLEKYGISESELTAPEAAYYKITAAGEMERVLLVQIVGMVCDTRSINHKRTKKAGRYSLWFLLTRAQYADVIHIWGVLRPALHQHLDDALRAFIHANNIFPPSAQPTEKTDLDAGEIARAIRVLRQAATMEPAITGAGRRAIDAPR